MFIAYFMVISFDNLVSSFYWLSVSWDNNMKLRETLLLFLILVSGVFAVTAYTVSKKAVDSVVQDLISKYSQVAAQHDIEQTLAPILEEVALAQKIATDPHIVSWGRNASDEVYRSTAEAVLERYRWQFKSKNFFIALDGDLSYHYNDVPSIRQPSYLRYYLEPTSVTDTWYFDQKAQGQRLSVNIAKDIHIDRTKVWINQAILDKGQFLGIVGTGMYIDLFTSQLAHLDTSSLRTFFVDEKHRVQLILESGQFDYPLRNAKFEKPDLASMIPNRQDLEVLTQFMRKQKYGQEAESLMIEQNQGRAVVSINYIEELGWYELTFVDVESMLPPWTYSNLGYIFVVITLLFGGFSYYYWLNVWVKPLEISAQRIHKLAKESDYFVSERSSDLANHLSVIEEELTKSRHSLHKMVVSRTAALDELTTVDVVTQLWNKKGLEKELAMEIARSKREQTAFGLIWIDLGLTDDETIETASASFESTLSAAGRGICHAIRVYDQAARWEDDEFIVLVRTKYPCSLNQLAGRIKSCILSEQMDSEHLQRLTDSLAIGGTVIHPGSSEREALTMADRALYLAKGKSGEKVYIHHCRAPADQIA